MAIFTNPTTQLNNLHTVYAAFSANRTVLKGWNVEARAPLDPETLEAYQNLVAKKLNKNNLGN